MLLVELLLLSLQDHHRLLMLLLLHRMMLLLLLCQVQLDGLLQLRCCGSRRQLCKHSWQRWSTIERYWLDLREGLRR